MLTMEQMEKIRALKGQEKFDFIKETIGYNIHQWLKSNEYQKFLQFDIKETEKECEKERQEGIKKAFERIDANISFYHQIINLAPSIIATVKEFNGKVDNCRFRDAIKASLPDNFHAEVDTEVQTTNQFTGVVLDFPHEKMIINVYTDAYTYKHEFEYALIDFWRSEYHTDGTSVFYFKGSTWRINAIPIIKIIKKNIDNLKEHIEKLKTDKETFLLSMEKYNTAATAFRTRVEKEQEELQDEFRYGFEDEYKKAFKDFFVKELDFHEN